VSTQENKALVRRFFEETWVKGNAAAVNEFMAADYVEHPRPSSLSPGPEGLKQLIDAYRTAFPDLDHKILTSSIGHYDRCCTGHHS
jgi:hypothetical protein